jgi:hypothetical protein
MRRMRVLCSTSSGVLVLAVSALVSGRAADWKAPPAGNFPLVGGNFANQRYSTLARIDRSNLNRLGGAWMVHAEDGRGGSISLSTVVVVDDVHGHWLHRGARRSHRRVGMAISGRPPPLARLLEPRLGQVSRRLGGAGIPPRPGFETVRSFDDHSRDAGQHECAGLSRRVKSALAAGVGCPRQFRRMTRRPQEVSKFWTIPGPGGLATARKDSENTAR